MSTYLLSRSGSFDRHVANALSTVGGAALLSSLEELPSTPTRRLTVLLHLQSYRGEVATVLQALSERRDLAIGAAADAPRLDEMLALTSKGVRAYFNSYMVDVHYLQMLEFLGQGQIWVNPDLLSHALHLARAGLDIRSARNAIDGLTPREREIANEVGRGLTNQQIAHALGISERTVKTHLTRAFKKLGVKTRVALTLALDDRDQSAQVASGR